ncbi:MAG TPA: VWA domain-containing protein [Vicinamibacterales bacterium]|nr:VWA domain-containing protein [Vicinamibacterales bacterium]
MRKTIFTLGVAACLAISASAQQGQKPEQPPVFRSSTRLVVNTVTVRDRAGKIIEGLTAKDFIVTEDNERQDIAFVEFQRLVGEPDPAATLTAAAPAAAPAAPVAAAAPPPQAPEVSSVVANPIATPASGDIKYRNRRLLILYFDQSATSPPDQMRVFDAALKYLKEQMQPADLIAIMTYGGSAVRVKQDFTDDKDKLRQVIEVLMYGEDKDGDGVRDPDIEGTEFGQNDAEFNVFSTDRQLAALQTAVNMLRPFPEQKSLIYFASNLRLNGTDNNAQMRATTNAANRANVSFFPVDARGLVAMAPLGDATQRSPGGIGQFSGALAQSQMSRFQRSQDTLYSLAKDTGGKAMFDYNDLSLGIVQAAEAQASYYIIGYYSTHIANDGKFRRVKVALANNLEGELAYRQGYYGDKEWSKQSTADRERQLEEALMLENPVTDITVALELNYFQLNSAEYFIPVSVKIPGRELALARRRGAQRVTLDFIAEIKDDPYGLTQGNMRDKVEKDLANSTAEQLATQPIQFETGFTLLPGKYVIKFLVRDAEAGRIGTYQTNFVIPNLNNEKQKLPISTVVLGAQRVPLGGELASVSNKATAAQAFNPLVWEGQKLLPSVTRVFSTSQDMHVYLQAYERDATTVTKPLIAYVTFFQGDVKVFETQPLPIVDGLNTRSKAVPIRLSVPLEKIPPGRYDCQIAVIEPAGQKVAFWQAPIAIVP